MIEMQSKYERIMAMRQDIAILQEKRVLVGIEKVHTSRESRRSHFRHFRTLGNHLTELLPLETLREYTREQDSPRIDKENLSSNALEQIFSGGIAAKVPDPGLLLPPSNSEEYEVSCERNRRNLVALGNIYPDADRRSNGPWWASVSPEDLGSLPKDVRTMNDQNRIKRWPFAEWKSEQGAHTPEMLKADCGGKRGHYRDQFTSVKRTKELSDDLIASLCWYDFGRKITFMDTEKKKRNAYLDINGGRSTGQREVLKQGAFSRKYGNDNQIFRSTAKGGVNNDLRMSKAEKIRHWISIGSDGRRLEARKQITELDGRAASWAAAICEVRLPTEILVSFDVCLTSQVYA